MNASHKVPVKKIDTIGACFTLIWVMLIICLAGLGFSQFASATVQDSIYSMRFFLELGWSLFGAAGAGLLEYYVLHTLSKKEGSNKRGRIGALIALGIGIIMLFFGFSYFMKPASGLITLTFFFIMGGIVVTIGGVTFSLLSVQKKGGDSAKMVNSVDGTATPSAV